MERFATMSECDRRSVLLLGATGAAALFAGASFEEALAAEAKEVAPGVTLKTLKEVTPVMPIPGFSKASLLELTFKPGAKFGPTTLKSIALCEIRGAPLYVEIKGKEPFTLQPGDIYACAAGMTETDTNKSKKTCVMRIMQLQAA